MEGYNICKSTFKKTCCVPGVLQLLLTTQGHCLPTPVGSRRQTACQERAPQSPWSQSQPHRQPPPKPLQSSPNSPSSKRPALHRTPLVKPKKSFIDFKFCFVFDSLRLKGLQKCLMVNNMCVSLSVFKAVSDSKEFVSNL